VYSYVAGRVGIKPLYELPQPLSPGILIYPVSLDDSVMYVLVSDTAGDEQVDFGDGTPGRVPPINLPAGHAAVVLIGKKEKAVIAKYGF
jgi:hypothetical protein